MGRRNRAYLDADYHHIYFRGINREPIVRDDEDRGKLLSLWEHYAKRAGIGTLCWSLLDTHAHGTVKARIEGISIFLQCALSQYAKWFNRRWGRFGNLFCDRFRSVPIRKSEHLRFACRYVLLNPVHAGICSVEQLLWYPWTSVPDLLEPTTSRFQSLDRETIVNLFCSQPTELRTSLFCWLRAKKNADDLSTLFYHICTCHGVSASEIRQGRRTPPASAARRKAARMMRNDLGMSTAEIGAFLRCSARCVRKLVQ